VIPGGRCRFLAPERVALSAPATGHPRTGEKLIVDTPACYDGIADVLVQIKDGQAPVVNYDSKRLCRADN
jgi:hypothetical protein